MKSHTFVICAYGESEYLEDCIRSVMAQTEKTHVLITTHTDNAFIRGLAEKYGLPVIVNTGEGGITQDWNFALAQVKTKLATLAHQDDFYEPDYAALMIAAMAKAVRPIIAFSDYRELRGGAVAKPSAMLKIKKLMLVPVRLFPRSKFMRRRALSFGNAICCPSVTYNLTMMEQPVFKNHFTSNEDWEAWEALSKKKGSFVYVNKPLMEHRIHAGSTTSDMLAENKRGAEDLEMFEKFWPRGIAKLLCKAYGSSEKYNEVDED